MPAAPSIPTTTVRPWHAPMTGRDPTEDHRTSTPLELLFDLCFVVAVGQAAGALHHDLSQGQIGHGIVSYLLVFFAIWWPWVNFTWFASAYDTDDVIYRLLTFVQIAGVLVVAAGVPRAFDDLDFTVMVVGYVIMRLALVGLWLRAAREDPAGRGVALRYAAGIGLVQIAWVARLALPQEGSYITFLLLGLVELAIPAWAERSGRLTPWHPDHIVERYGLFTIIVLGECVLAATDAVQNALAAGALALPIGTIALGGLVLVFGLWWSYFKVPAAVDRDLSFARLLAWGYGHYVIFASIAALGAGLQVATDTLHADAALGPESAAATVAVPVVIYLVALVFIHARPIRAADVVSIVVTAVLLVLTAAGAAVIGVPVAILVMGLLVAGLVALNVVQMQGTLTVSTR